VRLSEEDRAAMKARFGADFSRVRVHSDAIAARAATELRARAFTIGPDIYFAPGQFHPHQPVGRALLAHELTHVLQQAPGQVRRAPSLDDRETDSDPLEREARRIEQVALRDGAGAVEVSGRASTGRIQRSGEPALIETVRAGASGGLNRMADLVRERMPDRMSAAAVALDDLRRSLAGRSTVALTADAVHGLDSAHQQARALAPDWLPIPDLDFTPVPAGRPTAALAAVPAVAETALATEAVEATGVVTRAALRPVAVEATAVAAEVLIPAAVVELLLAALIVLEVVLAIAAIVGLVILVKHWLEKATAAPSPAREPAPAEAPPDVAADRAGAKPAPIVPPVPAARTQERAEPRATEKIEEQERQRGAYPLCWPTQLGCPCALRFQRLRPDEPDLTDDGQEKLRRDPAFTRRIQGVIKTTDIGILLKRSKIDIHHRHPLFLGGAENAESNALVLDRDEHHAGHASLNYQPQMRLPPLPLRPLDTNILNHPSGTQYYLAGMKNERDQTCVGAVVPGLVVPCSCEDPDLGVLVRNLLAATEPAPGPAANGARD
jgi:hypothetical protein